MHYDAALSPDAASTGRMATVVSWTCQLAAAAVLLQTLYFKFTFAPETQLIFARLGGRPAATVAGLVELACVVLLLWPRGAVWGALLALATMAGAIATHLLLIGIEVVDPATGRGDGGLLFYLALGVAAAAATIALLRRGEIVATVVDFV